MFDNDDIILNDVRLLRANRSPCPVCGHPTGDCVGQEQKAPIRIIGFSERRQQNEPGVLVEEDIYEEVYITDRTKTTVLVAKAGTYITMAKAIELGLKKP